MDPQITPKSITTPDDATIQFVEYLSPASAQRPGLIILHGGMESSYSHSELALALCSTVPVYVPNRRGRGASSDPSEDFGIQTEINDLKALLLATKAKYVLGVSSGAIINLYAALQLSGSSGSDGLIKKVLIFEPPMFLSNGAYFEERRQQFDREVDDGNIAGALITALTITEMAGWFFSQLPRWLLVPLLNFALWIEGKRSVTGRVGVDMEFPVRTLIPTIRFDFLLVKESQGNFEQLKRLNNLDVDVLLLSGSKSPDYLKNAILELVKLLPKAQHTEFDGLGHLGLGNSDIEGKPEQVAVEMRKFLEEVSDPRDA